MCFYVKSENKDKYSFTSRKEKKITEQIAKGLCVVFVNCAVAERTVRNWFTKFRKFELEEGECSGKRADVNNQIAPVHGTLQRYFT